MKTAKTLSLIMAGLLLTSTVAFAATEGFKNSGDGITMRNRKEVSKSFQIDQEPGSIQTGPGGQRNGDGRQMRQNPVFENQINVMQIAAEVLSISEQELNEKLKTTTLAELLEASEKLEAFKEVFIAKTQESLSNSVTNGILTQEQADEMLAKAKERIENADFLNNNFSQKQGFKEFGGNRQGGNPDNANHGMPFGNFKQNGMNNPDMFGIDMSNMPEIAAQVIGMTTEELQSAIKDKSLFQLIEESGKTDEFNTAMLDSFKANLNTLIEEGTITSAQSEKILEVAKLRFELMQKENSLRNELKDVKFKKLDKQIPSETKPAQ